MSALDEFLRFKREYEAEFGPGAFWRELAADTLVCSAFGLLMIAFAVMFGGAA